MKITINHIPQGEDEIIVNYSKMTPRLQCILDSLYERERKLVGWQEGQQVLWKPADILYLESVDGKTFAYTAREVCRVDMSLAEVEAFAETAGFFRCSKSMIINIYRVNRLKSLAGNRIDAQLENGEHIIISRNYAAAFRRRLKGGAANE